MAAVVLNDCSPSFYCLLFQQRKRNLPQTRYVELVLVVDKLRVSQFICLRIQFMQVNPQQQVAFFLD